MMMDFWSIWMDGFIFVVETKEFLVQHCILTAFSCWQCLTTFWVTKENWLDKFTKKTKKKTPVHLRWSWHCLFLLKRWWTWLSETRSRGGGGSAARFFFPEKWGKTLFFRFGARKPTPPPQGPIFQVSAQASANQRPRTTACGLHPGPLKCLVAWALTLKIVPWAGGVGSAADVWRCKWWSVIDEKVVVNRFYRSFQMYVYMYVCIYVLLK